MHYKKYDINYKSLQDHWKQEARAVNVALKGSGLVMQDERSSKLVVVAHCILNQNSRVRGLARRSSVIEEVVDLLRGFNVGLLQMPCPELTYAGAKRARKEKKEYDTESYRLHCRVIADSIVGQLEKFLEGTEVIAIIGVKNSPSCGVAESTEDRGILIEELTVALEDRQLSIPLVETSSSPTILELKKLEGILKR